MILVDYPPFFQHSRCVQFEETRGIRTSCLRPGQSRPLCSAQFIRSEIHTETEAPVAVLVGGQGLTFEGVSDFISARESFGLNRRAVHRATRVPKSNFRTIELAYCRATSG